MALINCKINFNKVPKDRYFKGQKGTYLDFTVAERREPDQYGNTHSVYLYNKDTQEKLYIGSGQLLTFEPDDSVLPPVGDVEDAEVVEEDNKDLPW